MSRHKSVLSPLLIATMLLLALLVSLTSLAQLARAASAAVEERSWAALPPAAPPPHPLLLDSNADLSITKTNGTDTTIPGQITIYTITVTNNDDDDPAEAIVSDAFSTAFTGVVAWSCSSATGATCGNSGNGDISDTVNLPPGSSVTYIATGTVRADVTGSLVNTAMVTPTAGITDPDSSNNSATDIDTLMPEADLSISKTSNTTGVVPGTAVTYTIIVSNSSGPSDISGAIVSDIFTATLSPVSWTCSGSSGGICSGSGSSNINQTVDLPVGGVVTFIVTGTVSPGATGSLANTAAITVPVGATDPNSTNNSATETDPLTPQADLSITKTSPATQVVPGTAVTYTIIVSNSSGPSDISDAIVSDIFTATLSPVSWTCSGSNGGGCSGGGSGNINQTVDLPVGGVVTFIVTGTVSPGATGSLANTAAITVPVGATDPNSTNNSATETDPLTPQVDLSISKTNGVSSLIPGTNTTYTIIVSNTGPSSVSGAIVTDTFPSLSGVSWICTGFGCTAPTSGSGPLNQAVNLSPGSSVTFSATGMVNPGARGTLVNTATVIAPAGVTDTAPGNNSTPDSDALTPKADLRVIKSDSPDPVDAGGILIYTITIFNDGPSDATGVTLSDNLDNSNVTFQSSTPSSPTCAPVGGDVGCSLGVIPSGGNISVTIRVLVKSSTPAGFVDNDVLVESPDESQISNNDASASTQVRVRPDLTITKLESADPSPLGEPLTYTLRITNNGPSDAPQVDVTDNMPNGVPIGSVTTTKGGCSTTDPITCNLGGMTSGTVATVTIVVNPTSIGTLNNSASVSVSGGAAFDLNSDNNSSSTSTDINLVTDLAITHADAPDPVIQGNNLTYHLTVTNNGPSNATDVSVTDTLPAGVTFQSVTSSQGSCSGTSTITCNLGSMARNGSAAITITVNINPSTSGNISNTATVSGGGGVDNPINNSATATTFVGILHKIYLPLLFKPAPTDLFIDNDTGGPVTFTVVGVVSCNVPAGEQNFFCGTFPPGTYTVQVHSVCGSLTTSKTYAEGPQTTRVFCN